PPRGSGASPLSLPDALPILGFARYKFRSEPWAGTRYCGQERRRQVHTFKDTEPYYHAYHRQYQNQGSHCFVAGSRYRLSPGAERDRKSTRLNSSHVKISYAV